MGAEADANSQLAGSLRPHCSQAISSKSPGNDNKVPHAGQKSREPIRSAWMLEDRGVLPDMLAENVYGTCFKISSNDW